MGVNSKIRGQHVFGALRTLSDVRLPNDVRVSEGAGVPTDGTSGTGAATHGKGSLYIDRTNGNIYINTNTLASPTWNSVKDIAGAEIAAGAITPVKMSLAIRNETGGSLVAGDLVYVSGWTETNTAFLVSKADADASGARAHLIVTATIANNANGTGNFVHRLTALNTSGATVGDPVYLSTTAAGWTLTAPTGASAIKQIVGRVAVVSATIGEVEFDLFSHNQVTFGTNELQDSAITAVKIAAAILNAAKVANVAEAGTTAGLAVVHMINVPSGANADVDVVLDHKIRVLDVTVVLTGAGTAGSLVTVKNTADAITNAMDVSAGGDKAVFRPTTIDDAFHEIAAAGTLRVSKASTGADFPGAKVYVFAVRVA